MKKLLAFSLVEVMVSLIVMSVITSAFAPVISKKMKTTRTVKLGGLQGLTMKCEHIDPECRLCDKRECILCIKDCTNSNEYREIPTCKCELCTSVYGPNCKKCDDEICTKCDDGYEYNETQGTCVKCSAGSYSDDGTECKPCSKGYYQDEEGKTSCKDCPNHNYCPTTGMTTPTKCSAGTQFTGTKAQAQTSCTNCPAGKFSNSGEACQNCAEKKWSVEGSPNCPLNCTAGYYCPGDGTMPACSDGYISAAGAKQCSACAENTWSNTAHTTCEACTSEYACLGNGIRQACSSAIASCATCSSSSNSAICASCSGGLIVSGNVCVSPFSNDTFTSSTTWTVPAGVTKITITAVANGNSGGTGSSLAAGSQTFSSGGSISLTGDKAALKGKSVSVELKGTNGSSGEGIAFSSYDCSSGPYCGPAGSGGSGAYLSGTLNVSLNASSISVTFNNGASGGRTQTTGFDGMASHTLGSHTCSGGEANSSYGNACRFTYGGSGGKGVTVTAGSNTACAGGGGGGSGANAIWANSVRECVNNDLNGTYSRNLGGPGGKGGGTCGGAGGTNPLLCSTGWSPANGSSGSGTISSGSVYSSYAINNTSAWGKVSWSAQSITGSGGSSGTCKVHSSVSVTPGTVCTVTIGSPSKLVCGSSTWSSDATGYSQNAASGSTGGNGYTINCASGSYGKGGNGSSNSSANAGSGGMIYITNAS